MRRDARLYVVWLLIGLANLFAAGTAAALGIGPVTLSSWLGEPLRASFPLYLDRPEQLTQVEVGLGEPADYAHLGLVYEGRLPPLTFEPVPTGEGLRVMVRSVEVVREPVLDLLVEVHSPEGRVLRSFTLLIDPPPAVTRPPAQAAPRADTLTVSPGDTLGGIARRLAPAFNLGAPEMQRALFEANPQAFAGGSPDRLLAGARLRLPPPGKRPAPEPVAESAPAVAGAAGPGKKPAAADAAATPHRLVLAAPNPSDAVEQMRGLLERAQQLNAEMVAENERLRQRVAVAERELVAATENVLARVKGALARAGETTARKPSPPVAPPVRLPPPAVATPAVLTQSAPARSDSSAGSGGIIWAVALAAVVLALAAGFALQRWRTRQVADWRPLEWQHR